MKTLLKIMVTLFIGTANIFALAPNSMLGKLDGFDEDILFMQEAITKAYELINQKYQDEVINHAFIFGSPIILQQNGYLKKNHLNDIDVMVMINIKYIDKKFHKKIIDELEKEVRKILKFKKIELIPRNINKASFTMLFKSYLKQLLGKLKSNEIMLNGKWYEVHSRLLTNKFIKRYLELLLYTQGETKEFLEVRDKLLQCDDFSSMVKLKEELLNRVQNLTSLEFTNYQAPFQIIDNLIAKRALSSKVNDIKQSGSMGAAA